MLWRSVLVCAVICAAVPAMHAQTPPSQYVTLMSQGKAIACTVYEAEHAVATIIYLRGPSAEEVTLSRQEANFFASHGFRVVVPDYLSVTQNAALTVANYRRWSQAVEDMVADLRARPLPQDQKVALAGQGLGASVALIAGSSRLEVKAIAEWSGLLPNQFFSQVKTMPPLLILHGELDEQVPIVNARQLVRLCLLKDFTCEPQIFAGEGHLFNPQNQETANQRALAFFRVYLH